MEPRYNVMNQRRGSGTLMGNWEAERCLHEFTGHYRNKIPEHIPKRTLDFELPPLKHGKDMDDQSRERTLGPVEPMTLTTSNAVF